MRAAALTTCLLLLASALAAQGSKVAGRLTAGAEQPVAEATVLLLPSFALARTDSAGYYELQAPGPGHYTLHAGAPHTLV